MQVAEFRGVLQLVTMLDETMLLTNLGPSAMLSHFGNLRMIYPLEGIEFSIWRVALKDARAPTVGLRLCTDPFEELTTFAI